MHNPTLLLSLIALILGSGALFAPTAAWADCANPPAQWLLCEDWENGGPVRDVLDDSYWTDEANWRPAEHGWDFTWSSYYCGAGPNALPAPGSPSGGRALELRLHPEDGTVCRSRRPTGDILANGWDTAFPQKSFSPRRGVYARIYHLAAPDFAWNININKLLYLRSSTGYLPNVKITGDRNSDYYNDYGFWPREGEFLLAGSLPQTYLGQNTGPAEAAIAKKGAWQCIEYYMNLGTSGANDGHLRLWVDDVLIMDYANLPNGGWASDISEVQLSGYYGGGGNVLVQAQSRWVDDIVVSASRIGCAGADTLAPAAPANLTVR